MRSARHLLLLTPYFPAPTVSISQSQQAHLHDIVRCSAFDGRGPDFRAEDTILRPSAYENTGQNWKALFIDSCEALKYNLATVIDATDF